MRATPVDTGPDDTAVHTDRDVLPVEPPPGSETDSPPARARARTSIGITERVRKILNKIRSASTWFTTWWGWIYQPPTLRATWDESGRIVARRIPPWANRRRLLFWWKVSNKTERLLLFVLIAITPLCLQAVIRPAAERPTRRIGLYVVLLALTVWFQLAERL